MNIQVTLSDIDVKVREDNLWDNDAWVQAAVIGKISNCKQRMLTAWQPILFADPEVINIPANEDAFINMVVARDDYKTRVQRDDDL